MTDTEQGHALALADVRAIWAAHLACAADEGRRQRDVVRATLRKFLADFVTPAEPQRVVIDKRGVLRWLIGDARGKTLRYVAERLAVLDEFLGALVRARLLDANPLTAYRTHYGSPSWQKVAQALQSDSPEATLAGLRPLPSVPGPLDAYVRSYLDLQRSLGKKCRGHQTTLFDLDHFLRDRAVVSPEGIDRETIEQWVSALTCGAHTRVRKTQQAQRFFDYLRSLSVVADNPVPRAAREPRSSFKPFIFTREQLAALLAEARRLPEATRQRCRIPDTYFTMLALLCSLGLRHGEVLRLRLGDLDLERQTLFIDQTKFHKSRYVPFGPKVGQCLRRYLDARRTVLQPVQPTDLLFTTTRRKAIHPHTLLGVFRGILLRLGIAGVAGQPPPRLHDVRHSFAVGRLLRWYQEGIDVQSRLPVLATFLGHVGPKSTEVYLTITAELLQQANARFHRAFGQAFDQEQLP